MYVKRLIAPLCVIAVLLLVAGILEMLIWMFPAPSEAVAAVEQTEVRSLVEQVNLVADEPERAVYVSEEAKLARQLADSDAVVMDGVALDRARAEHLVEGAAAAAPSRTPVTYIDQEEVLPSGCEIVALSVALRAEGIDADPRDIADNHLRKGSDAALDYLGDPESDGGGLPPCIVDAANGWLAAHGHDVRAHDLTGTSLQGVRMLVELGYPVMVWVTEGLDDPEPLDGGPWYTPAHCVVAYGFEGTDVLVSDSLEGLVRRDAATFARVYAACGSCAVAVA